MRDVARAERPAVARGVLSPAAVRQGLVQIQRIDERIVLAQVDEPRSRSAIAQRHAHPPGGRRETDVGRLAGVAATNPVLAGRLAHRGDVERAAAVLEQVHGASSASRRAPDCVGIQRGDAGSIRRKPAIGRQLTNSSASSSSAAEIFATLCGPFTIAILSPVVCLSMRQFVAGSNAMRRLLKWIACGLARRGRRGGGRIVRLVRGLAGAQHSRARTGRRIRLARPGLGRGAERRVAAALLLHRAGHLDAAGRLGRCGAL